jgi:hypothetical protein
MWTASKQRVADRRTMTVFETRSRVSNRIVAIGLEMRERVGIPWYSFLRCSED